MTNFETLSNEYLDKIQRYIDKCKTLTTLISEVNNDIPFQDRGQLIHFGVENKQVNEELEKFYDKISKREYKIAVVGLEGSGKSTFINSLIGYDFLPTQHGGRCTLASVEIKQSENKSHLAIVEYKTLNEFEDYVQDLDFLISNPTSDILIAGTSPLLKEKEQITISIGDIRGLLNLNGGKTFEYPCEDLQSLKNEVSQYITDPIKARAVKNITIYTSNLNLSSNDKEFSILDVPGYDSPLKFNKDQTIKNLSDADLIIFVHQISLRADLVSDQVIMMTISDNVNQSLKTKEKIFVFLNQIDRIVDPKEFGEKILIAKKDWSQYCKENNMYYGSAKAHLVEMGEVEDNHNSIETLKKLGATSGIDELKSAINYYLENERFILITNAIKSLFRKTDKHIQFLTSILDSHGYRADYDALNFDDENKEMFKEINLWWDSERKIIGDEFEDWYFNNVLSNANETPIEGNSKILNIKNEHDAVIDSIEWSIPKTKIEKQILKDMNQEIYQINSSNISIRKEYYEEYMARIDVISQSLSSNLKSVSNQIIAWIYQRLYGIDKVRDYFYSEFNISSYKPSVSALYIRHARPLVDVFMKAPHGSDDRKNIIKARKAEVNSLKISLELRIDLLRPIEQILNFIGITIEKESNTIDVGTTFTIEDEEHPIDFLNNSASTEAELKAELETDTDLLINLLKNTAFESSGIMEYCYQELDKIRRFFKIHLYGTRFEEIIIDHMEQIDGLSDIQEKVLRVRQKKSRIAELINKLED